MMNRAVVVMLLAAVLGGGAILYFWHRTPYEMEHRTLAGSTKTAILLNGPKIEIDRKEIDFGETLPVPEVAGKFIIRNTGKSLLELKPPHPSCGCTVSSLTADKLEPGEQAELPFTVSLKGIWGGDFLKNITLQSNDPSDGMVNLIIKGKVKQFVQIEPSVFSTGNLNYRDQTNLVASIRRVDGLPLLMTSVATTNYLPATSNIKATIEPVGGGNEAERRVNISLSSGGQKGWFNYAVKLFSDDANIAQPIYELPVSGRWVDEVFIEPEQLQLIVPPNTNWQSMPGLHSRRVYVQSLYPNRPVKVTKITASMDGFQFDVHNKENGSLEYVTITLDHLPSKTTMGTIVLETDNATAPKLELPFEIRLAEGK